MYLTAVLWKYKINTDINASVDLLALLFWNGVQGKSQKGYGSMWKKGLWQLQIYYRAWPGIGSFRPESRSPPESFRPYSRSPSFINSALKNEIWKIPLQIFIFWML
jgi:hypothetical protein